MTNFVPVPNADVKKRAMKWYIDSSVTLLKMDLKMFEDNTKENLVLTSQISLWQHFLLKHVWNWIIHLESLLLKAFKHVKLLPADGKLPDKSLHCCFVDVELSKLLSCCYTRFSHLRFEAVIHHMWVPDEEHPSWILMAIQQCGVLPTTCGVTP